MKKVVIAALITAAVMMLLMRRCENPAQVIERVVYDTIVRIDTLRVPVPVEKEVRVLRIDTLRLLAVQDADSTDSADSVDVLMPRQSKVYEDSTFRVVVSGYDATLDSMQIYAKNQYIYVNRTVERAGKAPRVTVTVGPQVGVGVTPKGIQPYAGVGISVGIRLGKR